MDYDVVQQQLCSALFRCVNIHPIWQGAPVVRQSVCLVVYILRIQTLRVMIMMMFKYSYIYMYTIRVTLLLLDCWCCCCGGGGVNRWQMLTLCQSRVSWDVSWSCGPAAAQQDVMRSVVLDDHFDELAVSSNSSSATTSTHACISVAPRFASYLFGIASLFLASWSTRWFASFLRMRSAFDEYYMSTQEVTERSGSSWCFFFYSLYICHGIHVCITAVEYTLGACLDPYNA